MSKKKLTPLSTIEAASFCSQMSLILKSGISSIEGITIMQEDAKEESEKELLSQIYETLLQTGIFYEALVSTDVFPNYLLQMVRIGEQTGRLDEVMTSLADYYEKESNLVQSIRHAITYPCIMLVMMLLVILVLITKVMPVFHQVSRQLGSEMTGFSRLLLTFGMFLNRHFIIVICIFAILALLFVYLVKSQKGHALLSSFLYRFAVTKTLFEQILSYRFSNGMALTLSSGLSPEECLRQTKNLIDNGPFLQKLDDCCKSVDEGADLCQSLLEKNIFTGIYARMALIGSRTGVLDEVMHTIAKQYEEDIDVRFAQLLSKIEPTLVIILSLIVGGILLSVMLPLMGIMAAL